MSARFAGTAARGLLLFILALSVPVSAQQNTPRVGYVYPAGGKAGSSFEILVGGQYLDGVTNLFASGTGIHAAVIEHIKPVSQGQFNKLRDALAELQKKKTAAARADKQRKNKHTPVTVGEKEDEEKIATIKKQMAAFQQRPLNPAIAETVVIKVSIDTNAPTGQRELRLATSLGLSNPLVFCVDRLPEFSEKLFKPGEDALTPAELRYRPDQRAVAATEMNIRLPAIVNGQILPGGRDRFRFSATKGQKLVVAVQARQLIPYLPDAVPGWFQATVSLFDAKGRELAFHDDFRFQPDPVLFFEVPQDGQYGIEIRDAIFRGREDFVYRISIGETPFITSAFPMGGTIGRQTMVQLKGWNLPVTTLTVTNRTSGVFSLSVEKDGLVSNHIPFSVDTFPEIIESEPNNPAPQKVTLPVIINGQVNKPGDTDAFEFHGQQGEEIIAEVHARRLGSPLDSILKLVDATGKQIASNDDHEDKGSGLNTHHADSYLRAKLPATGTYTLQLADTQQQGGPEYGYRLRVSKPQPDFELRIVPSSITVRGGATVPLTVFAMRKDGFTNEITLAITDQEGFVLGGARIPSNQDQVRVTLTAPPKPTEEPVSLSMEGYALINGQPLLRPVVPAEDMMQAFAYRHLVPAQELRVAVSSRYMQKSRVKMIGADPLKIPFNGTAKVWISTMSTPKQSLRLALSDPPEGISIKTVSFDAKGAELVVETDGSKVKQGLEGNLIVNVFAVQQNGSDTATKRQTPLGILPAIPFRVTTQ